MRSTFILLAALTLFATACGEVADQVAGVMGDGADAIEVGEGARSAPADSGRSGDDDADDGRSNDDDPSGDDDARSGDDDARSGDDDADDGGEAARAPGNDGSASGAIETVQAEEAGEVDVRVDGDRLELVDVREAPGWSHRIDDEERNEIEVDFRHESGRTLELELELELEGGRLKVEVDGQEL